MPSHTPSLEQVLERGCWTPIWRTEVLPTTAEHSASADWQAVLAAEDGSMFHVKHLTEQGTVDWQMNGLHSVQNGLAAIAAAYHVGISVAQACEALSNFAGIKRRMERVGHIGNVEVYDDFAHHPTAIMTTLDGARKRFGTRKIWAIIEPRSNTMKLGTHQALLAPSAAIADTVIWYQPPSLDWSVAHAIGDTARQSVMHTTADIIEHIAAHVGDDDVIIIMSNGGFEGIHPRLVTRLQRA